jgi:4-diphosphocytidyl-2-C-methyl-D-erythritol kinase
VTGAASGSTARVEAQAKVNLGLRVLAREEGGYHQLETVFCRIGLTDRVSVTVHASGNELVCTGEAIPEGGLGPPEQNLAWRAAAAYAFAAGFPEGFTVEVEKRIPVGGGLGGGSADAGAVLRCLNALNPRPMPATELLAIAGTLGADVPFLTQDRSPLALAWGRGDRLLTLSPLPSRRLLLFVPAQPVSTPDAYRWVDSAGISSAASAFALDDVTTWAGLARRSGNDLEAPVTRNLPGIGALLLALRQAGARGVFGTTEMIQMSGSGSTIFIVTEVGQPVPGDFGGDAGVRLISTTNATFVEPVVLTH